VLINKVLKYKAKQYKNYSKKSNIKIVKSGKVDTPSVQMHDRSLSWLGT
jgi:hypothetical protein